RPGLRENALRLAESRFTPELLKAAAKLAEDPSDKVRLQLACTLGEWKSAEAGEILGRIAVRDHASPFIVAAVMSSATPHLESLVDICVRVFRSKASVGRSMRWQTPARRMCHPCCSLTGRAAARKQKAPASKRCCDESHGRSNSSKKSNRAALRFRMWMQRGA